MLRQLWIDGIPAPLAGVIPLCNLVSLKSGGYFRLNRLSLTPPYRGGSRQNEGGGSAEGDGVVWPSEVRGRWLMGSSVSFSFLALLKLVYTR